jgi:uncharacterized membrane protein
MMNNAHYHLALNHLPLITPFIGFLILVTGIIFPSAIIKRVAYSVFILGAFFTIPAFLTGDMAGKTVESLVNIKPFIHEHEEKAEAFAMLSYILGAMSLLGLWANWKQKTYSNTFSYMILTFVVVMLIFAKQTATTGGEIRHTEIRANYETDSIRINKTL